MTVVAGRNRVNRPYFFTDTDGNRVEFPSFGTGQGDLEGGQLAEFQMYERAGQIEPSEVQVAPFNIDPPAVSGDAQVGETLTGTDGEWGGTPAPVLTRQWLRGSTAISGATAASHTLVAADVGQAISVRVTATNSQGSAQATSAATAAVSGIAPVNTVAPALSGTPIVGETLTVTNGTWTGTPAPTYARAWLRDGSAISGATGTTYVLTEDDVDASMTVRVTGTNSAGNAQAVSNALGPVVAAEPEEP